VTLGKTVGQLLEEIDSVELSEWLAYDRIEPLPDLWAMHGQLASLVHNAWFKGRSRGPEDFIPARRERREQSPQEQMAIVDRLRARMALAR
jgi:hypothetical protein